MGGGLSVYRRLAQYAQLFVSAALMWAAFPEVDLWFLAIPSVAFLVAALDQVRPLRGAWYSSLWCMVFFLAHIPWMITATGSIMPWIALSLAQAFFLAWFGAFFAATRTWKWCRSVWGETIVFAVLWVGIEQLRARVPFSGFPWAKLAYAQVDSPLVVFAPLGGEVLVSAIVVALAVLLRKACQFQTEFSPWRRFGLFAVIAIALVVPLSWHLPTSQQAGSISIVAIQGNVQVPGHETFAQPGKVTNNHLTMTRDFLRTGQDVDVVLWGEDSADRDPNLNGEVARMVQSAAEESGVPVVIGYQEMVEDGRYNYTAIWYPGSGLDAEKYAKQHPVPWGEYVPFREISEWLATEAAAVSVDMIAADNSPLLHVRLNDGRVIPIAVGICFEVGDETIISDGIRLGGQMILIPTNNFFFEDTAESTQQLQMARFRAAEFSRSTIQVSTNGVSGIIRPDGALQKVTDKQVADTLYAKVPLRTSLTPAAVMGEYPAFVYMGVTLLFGFVSLIASPIRRRKLTRV